MVRNNCVLFVNSLLLFRHICWNKKIKILDLGRWEYGRVCIVHFLSDGADVGQEVVQHGQRVLVCLEVNGADQKSAQIDIRVRMA